MEEYILVLDGNGDYIEIHNHPDLSLVRDVSSKRIGMTVHAEIRSDVLDKL